MTYPKTKAMIDQMLLDEVMSGVVCAFYHQGELEVLVKGDRQRVPHTEPMTRESVFDIASLTKVVGTTTVIFQLIEEGKLSLEDAVCQYLPIQSKALKVRHLLTHTSDFQGYIPNRNSLPAHELSHALLSQMQPGERLGQWVTYSDINFLYLGWIVEVITGQPIQRVIEERVIIPLGMHHTSFHPTGEIVPTEQDEERGLICGEVHDPKTYRLQSHSGSAGLFSTVDDLLTFAMMYLNGGKSETQTAILSQARIESLSNNYVEGANRPYSLGWNLETCCDHYVLTHTGYTGTYLLIDPIDERCFIFLSNRIHPNDDKERYIRYRDQLIQTYLKEIEE